MRTLILSSLALFACKKTPLPAPPIAPVPAPAETETPPGLLVLIVVDQLPERLLQLPASRFTGGLARLTGPEAARHTGHYAHAITYTCPGHATISTGTSPREHGISSNYWWQPDPDGAGEQEGESIYCGDPANLRVGTLADRVIESGGLVASVSLKDRAAMMLGGVKPTSSAWYSSETGDFTNALAGRVDIAGWLRPWDALFPEDYATWVGADADPDERDPGIGVTFPHPAPTPGNLLYTPFAGEALVDAALLAMDDSGLGRDATPDLLAVSFSQTDYIGHAFTAESWEAVDGMIRLDRSLGRLMDEIDTRAGDRGVTYVLTSDHGSFTSADKVRVPLGRIADVANAALAEMGEPSTAVFEAPSLWLPDEVRADPARRALAARAVAVAVAGIEGIDSAYPWRDDEPAGPHAEAVRQSFDDVHSGDVYVMRGENALFDYEGSEGMGTSHGTPFAEDTEVPFLMWGRGVMPGSGQTFDMRQVAPTAADLLGVPPPDAATLPPAR